LDESLATPEQLSDVLRIFLTYAEPELEQWDKASGDFKDRIAEHGRKLANLLGAERRKNAKFRAAFEDFVSLCRDSLNPALSKDAVEEMLVQHLLTWRIFKGIFDAGDFMQKNVIAREIEEVILTIGSFSREDFLKSINPFYVAVERAAAKVPDFRKKQEFLNKVYERFFQGFAVKQADTLGIVYTPQPIVDFMVASTERLLSHPKFGKRSLAHENVHILDGFTGTGNFIVNIVQFIAERSKSKLPHKYEKELHCNEVMLLPYYVASMNIEHAYLEAVGAWKTFEGICLVDTFDTAEEHTGGGVQAGLDFHWKANTKRIQKQRATPIFVCIGNPPYNAWQINENDNNRNRKYPELDERVRQTYGNDSAAQNRNSLSDPYIKAIRWASDRVLTNGEGIVAFVTNNAFLDSLACDGVRKHLAEEFDEIRVVDLGGNVRKNPKLSGTTHNVFGIQVGVSVNFFIRHPGETKFGKRNAKIYYHAVPTDWRRTEKYEWLEKTGNLEQVAWQEITPDKRHNWLQTGLREEFGTLLPLGDREAVGKNSALPPIFRHFSNGVKTQRDAWAVNFQREALAANMERMIDTYNSQVESWHRLKTKPTKVESFIDFTPTKISWSESLKKSLERATYGEFEETHVRPSLYRPFTTQWLYFDKLVNERRYGFDEIFPEAHSENKVICVTDAGGRSPFSVLASDRIVDLHLAASTDTFQCFPFYRYDDDGTNRQENIGLSALLRFQSHYGDDKLTRWDIFHYVYALLHHPGYRERFAANLKRELPRIPVAPEFRAFARAGKKLMELHLGYEQAKEYPLKRIENPDAPINWRVDPKMRLTPDRRAIIYNEFLTLEGIPAEAFDYKLGNRSALDWVIDQYEVSVDKQSGITNDPNRADDEQYIVRLIGQVITVSLETLKIVQSLPVDFGASDSPSSNRKELREWRMSQTHWMNSEEGRQQREELEKSLILQETPSSPTSSATSSSRGREKKGST
jgi:predicted helicase